MPAKTLREAILRAIEVGPAKHTPERLAKEFRDFCAHQISSYERELNRNVNPAVLSLTALEEMRSRITILVDGANDLFHRVFVDVDASPIEPAINGTIANPDNSTSILEASPEERQRRLLALSDELAEIAKRKEPAQWKTDELIKIENLINKSVGYFGAAFVKITRDKDGSLKRTVLDPELVYEVTKTGGS